MGLAAGAKLGPYEIVTPLGAGGMGDVYRARDTRLDRGVAIKVLPEKFFEDKERTDRFEKEAKLLAAVNHPNIAAIYSFEEISGRFLLVQELLEGESLREKLGAPLPPRKAIEYTVQAVSGLAAAHEKGIVHRDLKPENLFVTKDGRIKILDFGIAKLMEIAPPDTPLTEVPTLARETEPGVVMGTIAYMSPEQVLGKPIDSRSDLFSLGVVLYEMLSGKKPFQKATAPETMAAILKEELPDLLETNRSVSPGLDRIVRHCLEKEPSSRFQSARDVAFALESLSQATAPGAVPLRTLPGRSRRLVAAAGAAAIGACIMVSFTLGKEASRTPLPSFKRVTLRRGMVASARFAVVRTVEGRQRLEYPVGKVLVEATGLEQIASPSISPDGYRIAYVFMPVLQDPSGDICVVDLAGRVRTLSKGWYQIADGRLGWSPDGNEIWFSATRAGFRQELHSVTLSGKERLVARLPGNAVLQDFAPDGRVLVAFGQTRRFELRGRMASDSAERDLSWLDGTFTPLLSADGRQMLFQEWGEGGSAEASTYYRRMDGSAPTRLGEGTPVGVSPDWTTALALVGSGDGVSLKLVPIGAGETRTLPRGPVRSYQWALWPPKGSRIVVIGSDDEGQIRLYGQDLEGGLPAPLARLERLDPDAWLQFTTDGRFLATPGKGGEPFRLCSVDGGATRPIPFLKSGETPIAFGEDGASLYVSDDVGRVPLHVQRLDLRTGRRDPWLELAPPDRAGVLQSVGPWMTPNGRFYAYSYQRVLSDLYVVEGLK